MLVTESGFEVCVYSLSRGIRPYPNVRGRTVYVHLLGLPRERWEPVLLRLAAGQPSAFVVIYGEREYGHPCLAAAAAQ